MHKFRILILISILTSLPIQATADSIVNGGFETSDFTGWTLDGDPASNFVDSGFPHGGLYNASLGETGHLGSLSQSIVTDIGTSYTLSFWFAGGGNDPSEFTVSIGGNLVLDLMNPPSDGYQLYTYNFTATSTSTPIEFKFRDDNFFMYLDDVSVTSIATVPEPSSMLLIGTGLIVIGGYIRYRRTKSPQPSSD